MNNIFPGPFYSFLHYYRTIQRKKHFLFKNSTWKERIKRTSQLFSTHYFPHLDGKSSWFIEYFLIVEPSRFILMLLFKSSCRYSVSFFTIDLYVQFANNLIIRKFSSLIITGIRKQRSWLICNKISMIFENFEYTFI